MNAAFWIAKRYFKARKKTSFISIISSLAMLGVGVGTAALVIVLSVLNGMEDLHRQMFKSFDADLKITPAVGKRFEIRNDLLRQIKKNDNIQTLTEVIEDNALAIYGERKTIVKLKGVSDEYLQTHQLDKAIVEGKLRFKDSLGTMVAIGITAQNELGVTTQSVFTPLELWYPQADKKNINFSSTDAFNQQLVRVSAIFMLDVRYDNYIIAPLATVNELFKYNTQRSALEIKLTDDTQTEKTKDIVQKLLGTNFIVRTRDEQNANLLRAIRIEKLFVAVTLALIVLVAAVNIFFSLTMLVLEKKEDIKMLRAMGATNTIIQRIFLFEGAIVSLTGATVGLILGIGICLLQQHFGIISLGMANAVVDAYPVKLIGSDLLVVALTVILATILVAYLPAKRAAKI